MNTQSRNRMLVTLIAGAVGIIGTAATTVRACPPISPVCTTDIVGSFVGGCWTGPNGITNPGGDIFALVKCVTGAFEPLCGGGTLADVCDVNCDGDIDECDLQAGICGFQGAPCCDPTCDPPTAAPAPFDVPKNRYISFSANSGLTKVAYEVVRTTPPFAGPLGYVGAPNALGISSIVSNAVVMVWPGVVDVGDCEIIPDTSYEVNFDLPGVPPVPPVAVDTTPVWCDIVGVALDPVTLTWPPPNGVVTFGDVQAALHAFLGVPTAPDVTRSDLQAVDVADSCLNRLTNFADIYRILITFTTGAPYPFLLDPSLCPACPP